jgi:hypothetical protein
MNYRGIIAVIIAGSLGLSIILAVASLAWRNRPLAEHGAEALMVAINTLGIGFGYYMGKQSNGN